MRKGMRELQSLLPDGMTVVVLRNGHYGIVRGDGERVRTRSGSPITFAFSPGDQRSIRNGIATLKREGVI